MAKKVKQTQATDFAAVIRAALGNLRDLPPAPRKDESDYARLVLQAHFAEDRNECLDERAIRAIGRRFRA